MNVDEDKGNKLLLDAAQQDDKYGLLCKAMTLYHGIGGEKDYATARLIFENLTDNYNSKYAFRYLYFIYRDGLGVPKDKGRAVESLKRAADLGYAVAETELAVQYLRGDYIDADYKKALHYALEAQSTVAKSAYLLGYIHENGMGVPIDNDEAKEWYRQALDMGYEKAREELTKLQ